MHSNKFIIYTLVTTATTVHLQIVTQASKNCSRKTNSAHTIHRAVTDVGDHCHYGSPTDGDTGQQINTWWSYSTQRNNYTLATSATTVHLQMVTPASKNCNQKTTLMLIQFSQSSDYTLATIATMVHRQLVTVGDTRPARTTIKRLILCDHTTQRAMIPHFTRL